MSPLLGLHLKLIPFCQPALLYAECVNQNVMETPFFAAFPEDYRHLLGSESGQTFLDELTEEDFRDLIWECLTGLSPTTLFGLRFLSQRIVVLHHGIQQMFDLGKDDDEQFVISSVSAAARWLDGHFRSFEEGWTALRLKEEWRSRGQTAYSRLNHDQLVDGLEWAESNPPYKLSPADRKLCFWLIGSTPMKGWNILFGENRAGLAPWAVRCTEELTVEGDNDRTEANIIAITKHSASLSKKGGAKSMMGNFLEDPILFSAFSLCGLTFVGREVTPNNHGEFSLNHPEGGDFNRQADAVIRLNENTIFIDIGFINSGNPEIITDKMQRFQQIEDGNLENTIIIISQADETGEVARIAGETQAHLIIMEGNNWVNLLRDRLREQYEWDYEIEIERAALPATDDIFVSMKDAYSRPTTW
jgi:hypothetical protein